MENVKKNQNVPELTQVLAEIQKMQEMIKTTINETERSESKYSQGIYGFAKVINNRIEAILQGDQF